ncbi:hypothetical protein DMENIID0001_090010 [Sergentomyia squamirostris]
MGNQVSSSSVDIDSIITDVFSCPVCYEEYSDQIIQCSAGHDVCGTCAPKLPSCPVCYGSLNGTRNYSMETFIRKVKGKYITIEDNLDNKVKIKEDICTCLKSSKETTQTNVETTKLDSVAQSTTNENFDDRPIFLIKDDNHNVRVFETGAHGKHHLDRVDSLPSSSDDFPVVLTEDELLHNLRSFSLESDEPKDVVPKNIYSEMSSSTYSKNKFNEKVEDDFEKAIRLSLIEY